MKYMRQFGIIMFVTCLGEVLKYLIPLAIPSSIYGLCLMMLFLVTGIVKVDSVRESGSFLIEIMPIMLKGMLIPLIVITIISTILVIVVAGKVTQFVIKKRSKKNGSGSN